jgi:hypothetical protein
MCVQLSDYRTACSSGIQWHTCFTALCCSNMWGHSGRALEPRGDDNKHELDVAGIQALLAVDPSIMRQLTHACAQEQQQVRSNSQGQPHC